VPAAALVPGTLVCGVGDIVVLTAPQVTPPFESMSLKYEPASEPLHIYVKCRGRWCVALATLLSSPLRRSLFILSQPHLPQQTSREGLVALTEASHVYLSLARSLEWLVTCWGRHGRHHARAW